MTKRILRSTVDRVIGHAVTEPRWLDIRPDDLPEKGRAEWMGHIMKIETHDGRPPVFKQIDYITEEEDGMWRLHLIPATEADYEK